MIPLHPIRTRANIEPLAQATFARFAAAFPRWDALLPEMERILRSNASVRSKLGRFRAIADDIQAVLAPMTPCRRGCSHCCNIPVIISQAEADEIGRAIGRPARQVAVKQEDRETVARRWHGQPCPFLQDNACSIYAHRPMACRLHATLDVDDLMCDLSVPSSESMVPNIDLTHFWLCVGIAGGTLRCGDLREFFPGGTHHG